MSTEDPTPLTLLGADIAKRIVIDGDCWRWTGSVDFAGYGMLGGRRAHRMTYEIAVGPIPNLYVIDHLCRNHSCVKPAHLEPVTSSENVYRGIASRKAEAKARLNAPVTHGWTKAGFRFPAWVECECGYRPLNPEQMIAHDATTREAVSA